MRIGIYMRNFSGGGSERSMIMLAQALAARGHQLTMLVDRSEGKLRGTLGCNIRLVELAASSKWQARLAAVRACPADVSALLKPVLLARHPNTSLRYLSSLARYLRSERPDALISALTDSNLVALWARELAGVDIPIVVTEHNTLSRRIADAAGDGRKAWRAIYLPQLIERTYPRAAAIVSVSNGVGDDLAAVCGLDRCMIRTIYNPVVSEEDMHAMAPPGCNEQSPVTPAAGPALILAVGRLVPQKGFDVLIDAFAQMGSEASARLVILGEGKCRQTLERQIGRLGLADRVTLAGWVADVKPHLHAAQLLVCSSRWEGLGNVLIEALACGCPVVSTDCPHGPREILDDGRYGTLVPPDNASALAEAMASALRQAVSVATDRQRLQDRARLFSVASSADAYEAVLAAGKSSTRQ